MADDDRLRLEYERQVASFRDLTDIRFKLLALVPTLSGAAVALLKGQQAAVTLIAVGVLGVSATLGVLVYELRNSEIRRGAARADRRARTGAARRSARDGPAEGRAEALRAPPARALARARPRLRSRARRLVYLVVWGILDAANAGHAREIGVAIGAVAGLVVLLEVLRIDGRD